jgi:hypothetical protein
MHLNTAEVFEWVVLLKSVEKKLENTNTESKSRK